MAVPDFQTLMRPLLEGLVDGDEHSIRSIRGALVQHFSLSQADVDELIPSGRVTTFQNRVGWATTYLYRAGLIERPRRAVYRITERGRSVLDSNPDRVDLGVLSQFEEFEDFRRAKSGKAGSSDDLGAADSQTPEERITAAYRELRSALAGELIERVQDQTAEFFEQLVLDVLHAMGYGGSREEDSERLGRTGDEGVDGVIREDRLGLDAIYIQAKKWSGTVGRPEIQKFVGALQGQKATKGVFIATSSFSPDAIAYAEKVTPRVILIDGQELAQLMMEHDVGVSTSHTYRLKRLDLDYFVIDESNGAAETQDNPAAVEAPSA